MPTLFFEGNVFGGDLEVQVPDGGPLVDVCDDASAPVPFSCRSATCGTCRIEVVEGWENLSPPTPDETYKELEEPYRLSCQTMLLGDATVKVAKIE